MNKPASICRDNLKYLLKNIIANPKPTISDQKILSFRRLLAYKNIFQIYQENKLSNVKAENLYSLLYSKYSTQRYMIRITKEEPSLAEDDEATKQQFRDLLAEEFATPEQLESKYLEVVKGLKNSIYFIHYKDLNDQMVQLELPEDLREIFLVGTTETDIFLEEKLTMDINKLLTTSEKCLEFLSKYRFLNGWITAAGILSFIGFASPLAKHPNTQQ